jgi:hypothetical protein
MTWHDDALALGWSEWRLYSLADLVARQQGAVVLVTAEVIAFRAASGSLQAMVRSDESGVIARANEATKGIPSYLPPPDPFCPERDCTLRVPCPVHGRVAAGGGR